MREFFYKHKDTRFHRLNPIAKFFICAAIIVAALIIADRAYLTILFLISVVIAIEAKITPGWLFYLKVAAWIGVFIVLLNLVLSQSGETVLFQAQLDIPFFETIRITLESLLFGFTMALRLAVVISAFAVFALTVSPEETMWLMAKSRIPAKSVFLTSLSARFVPSLLEDVDTLTQVQKARGAKLRGIRGKGPIIIPLLSNSLERSVSVAEAMEARGFSGEFSYRKTKKENQKTGKDGSNKE